LILIFFEQERTKSHMMRLSFSEQANDEKKKKEKKDKENKRK